MNEHPIVQGGTMKLEAKEIEFLSEEDLKNKVLLPYLQSLGFGVDDLSFEKNFSLQLGRSKHKVGRIHGRLDVLCKHGKQNLFVIEVKGKDVDLLPRDVDQGISYARLVDPIAPFVIVTNGKSTKVVDTITKQELSGSDIANGSPFWKNGCKLSAGDELNQRLEALSRFIGYSKENLTAFSRSQLDDRMQTLKGNRNELHKKYIPDLFLSRLEIVDSFRRFLLSRSQCFALIGEAGVGKTNFMCGLAETMMNECIVLFLNGTSLIKNVPDSLREDFNWVFSQQLEANEILQRLNGLATNAGTQVCIFVDALDEIALANVVVELDDFVRKLKQYPDIRLCLSCKLAEWDRFLVHKGNPTYLSESLFVSDADRQESGNLDVSAGVNPLRYGFLVQRFSETELTSLDQQYRGLFRYTGALSDELNRECRLGFMLRVVASVYSGKELPATIDDIDLLEEFVFQKLTKTEKETAQLCLRELGKVLVEGVSLEGGASESDLRARLNVSANQKLFPDLFAYSLLVRRQSGDGNLLISFYHSRVRDYVVAIVSLSLNSKTGEGFMALVPMLMQTAVGQSALSWYSSVASEEHRKILMAHSSSRALIFLDEYTRILREQYPAMMSFFEPRSTGEIGLVMQEPETRGLRMYGFRAIRDDQKRLEVLRPSDDPTVFYRLGAHWAKGRGADFVSIDPKEAANEEIRDQLTKMVEKGQLNEEANFSLAIEKIFSILYSFGEKLGLKKPQRHSWVLRVDHLLPIGCADIASRLKLFNAKRFYEWEVTQEMIKEGGIQVSRDGGAISYSVNQIQINPEVERRAKLAIERGMEIPEPNIVGDFPPFKALASALRTVQTKRDEIKEPLLPEPDIPQDEIADRIQQRGGRLSWILDIIAVQYSDVQLKRYLEVFFSLFLTEYRTLVETCFPRLKNKLWFYELSPAFIYVEAQTANLTGWTLSYGYSAEKSTQTIVIVDVNASRSQFDLRERELVRHYSSTIDHVFHDYQPVLLQPQINSSRSNEMCVLRSWVYQQVKEDMKEVLESSRKRV